MNRDIWLSEIYKRGTTPYECPHCKASVLKVDEDSLVEGETPESKSQRTEDGSYGEETSFYKGAFAGSLVCPGCSESVYFAGDSVITMIEQEIENGHFGEINVLRLVPRFFSTPPAIIAIPDETPVELAAAIEESFSLFFSDTSAAAYKIRVALELLLDDLRVPRTDKTKAAKRRRLTLKERVDRVPARARNFFDHLDVFRILGNEGAHGNDFDVEKLLDLFEVLEDFLEEYYNHRSKNIRRIIKSHKKKRK